MTLLEFKHDGDPVKNRELFGLMGEDASSTAVREKLGGFISSEPGRLWFIMTEGERNGVMAFGSVRIRRASAHILHLYALEEGGDIPLLERCIEAAREAGVERLITTDYWTRRDMYLQYGFRAVRKLGRFLRFEKEFEHGRE